ncbi:MAG: hypothetical protein ACAI38_16460 [Myxococcota bacterium]|nr:hypothetical protein [Myxococcota bacterium]
MQKLFVGLVLAASCFALPARAAEGDPEAAATEEQAAEAPAEGALLDFKPKPAQETETPSQPAPDGTIQQSDTATDTSAQSTTNTRKSLSDAATSTLTKNVLLQREQAVRTKRFGLLAAISTFAGSGTFLDNSELRHQNDYVAQIFDIRPTIGFNAGSHRLRLSGRVAFETEYTQPNTNPSRRWKPYDTSVTLADDTLWKEPVTGILFNAAFRMVFPTSYESINVRQQWLATGLVLGARRLVGDFQLSFNSSVTKYFNGSKTAVRPVDNPRPGDQDDGRDTNDFARPRLADSSDLNFGTTNNSWLFANTLGVTWLASDRLAVSYSLGILSFIRYSVQGDRDAFTSPFADSGNPTAQRFQSGLEVSYDLSHYTKEQWNLPFSLTVALGVNAIHPVQDVDNDGWIAPVIFNSFTNRAANNYGAFYLDLVAIY